MQEIDIQNKLADWQQRMDKKHKAEEEQKRLEVEKQRQQYLLQRTGRAAMRS